MGLLWKQIKHSLTRQNPAKQDKHFYKQKVMQGWNIYDPGVSLVEHHNKFNRIHFVFKYRFFVPLLLLGEKLLGKYKAKGIPDFWYNRNVILFDKAFEASILDWTNNYLHYVGDDDPEKRAATVKSDYEQGPNQRHLRTMKDMTITLCLNDTAYKEFLTILMHHMHHEMHQEYSQDKYLDPITGKCKVNHLFYTSRSIYDVNYVALGNAIENNEVKVAPAQSKPSVVPDIPPAPIRSEETKRG